MNDDRFWEYDINYINILSKIQKAKVYVKNKDEEEKEKTI